LDFIIQPEERESRFPLTLILSHKGRGKAGLDKPSNYNCYYNLNTSRSRETSAIAIFGTLGTEIRC
jgi:hypothetical protein